MPKISAANVVEHKRQTWDALLDAMDGLLMERTWENVSMREVAERAGISRTAVYNYAPDTTALLLELVSRRSGALEAAVRALAEDEALDASARLVRIVSLLLVDFPRSTNALLIAQSLPASIEKGTPQALAELRAGVGATVLRLVRHGIATGEFAAPADPEVLVALLTGLIESALGHIAENPETAEVVATVSASVVLCSLAPHSE